MREHRIKVFQIVRRLLLDDRGATSVDYAILTGLIAVGTILVFSQLASVMHNAYAGPGGWNEAAQEAWEPCEPALGSCPSTRPGSDLVLEA